MKKMMSAAVLIGLAYASLGEVSCDKCKDKGYVKERVECYLCKGEETVSPSYYGNDVETELHRKRAHYWEWEKKQYSRTPCPLCRKSKDRGNIETISPCSCGKNLKALNKKNYGEFVRMAKSMKVRMPKGVDQEAFYWTKLMYEKRNNWIWDSKNKAKLLEQALNRKYEQCEETE